MQKINLLVEDVVECLVSLLNYYKWKWIANYKVMAILKFNLFFRALNIITQILWNIYSIY